MPRHRSLPALTAVLLATMLSAFAPAAARATQLGAYVGFPDSDDASIDAATNAQLVAFTRAIGRAPTLKLLYIDAAQKENKWADNNAWAAASWRANRVFARGSTPVLGIPMAQPGDPAGQDFRRIAAGAWDGMFRRVFAAWAEAGVTAFDIRPGWEMNGTWMNWSVTAANAADFVAAFRRIADLAHRFPRARIRVVFNPNTGGTVPLADYYPGNAAVDAIGLDFYGQPVGADAAPAATARGPGDIQLTQFMAFARQQGKPFGLAEIGAGAANTIFPGNLAAALAKAGEPLAFLNIWDVPGGAEASGSLQWSSNPAAAAAWRHVVEVVERLPEGGSSLIAQPGRD
jgi:hypothetical protein